MAYSSFEDLEVWKRACNLTVEIYKILKDFRDYGLKDQMTRAAVSIASNIAEGAERGSSAYLPEPEQFLGTGQELEDPGQGEEEAYDDENCRCQPDLPPVEEAVQTGEEEDQGRGQFQQGLPGGAVDVGTTFPVSPTTWDKYFRTDIYGGTEFSWDGTRWLSSQTLRTSNNARTFTTGMTATTHK